MALIERPGGGKIIRRDHDRGDAVGAPGLARATGRRVILAVGRFHPQLPAVPAAGERFQQVERLGQHMRLGHRLKARHVEAGQQALQRGAVLAGECQPHWRALAVIAGVEHDQPALFHVGIDLGERCFRQRLRVGQHGPVQHGVERYFVGREIDANGVARLDRSLEPEVVAKTGQPQAAGRVGVRFTRDDIAKRHLAGCPHGGLLAGVQGRSAKQLGSKRVLWLHLQIGLQTRDFVARLRVGARSQLGLSGTERCTRYRDDRHQNGSACGSRPAQPQPAHSERDHGADINEHKQQCRRHQLRLQGRRDRPIIAAPLDAGG